MAPRPTYPAPHKQLGELMVQARREGLSFGAFWERAMRPNRTIVLVTDQDPPVGAVRWPTDRDDRVAWRAAIVDGRDGWRRAYERAERTRGELALVVLGDAIGALAAGAEDGVGEELVAA